MSTEAKYKVNYVSSLTTSKLKKDHSALVIDALQTHSHTSAGYISERTQ